MNINQTLLESEIEKYNKIVEELQKLQGQTQQLEITRLKLFGRLELIQEAIQEEKDKKIDPALQGIKIDELIQSENKKKKTNSKL